MNLWMAAKEKHKTKNFPDDFWHKESLQILLAFSLVHLKM